MKSIRTLLYIFGLLLLSFTGQALATQCPTSNIVTNPVMFQWTHHPITANNSEEYYSGTLEMGKASFMINGETLTTRAYRQEGGAYSIPGPTIVMEPGKKYVLRFKNTLPYEPLNPEHNVYKDPNVTNVHTHGIHISGESPADDVTRIFEGGFGGDYVYEIPSDHMGGTFWYHAHHHGSTFLQVSSGAFGLMLIDDGQDNIPANVASMVEKHLAFGFLEPVNAAGTGGDTLISGTFSQSWTINGLVNGAICMPPNTWQHWRMLVADQDSRLVDVEIGPNCEIALMARDGVWRTQVPKAVPTNTMTLTAASRADIAIRCSGDASVSIAGTPVAQIHVDGVSDATSHPYAADGTSEWPSQRPAYLRDLRGKPISNSETIRMGARSILGSKFDANVPNLTQLADGIQEWSLNGATNHPFHLHVYHVQVQNDCGSFEAGEYYDVIAGNCDIRFDLNPATSSVYNGRTIFHCHILEHEDQGAMAWLDVVGGMSPPTFPVNTDIGTVYGEYYALGDGSTPTTPSAPSSLTAVAISSDQIDLVWTDNATDENGFDIERSTDGVNFAVIASTSANVTVFSDTGLAANTTYSYRVSAFNSNGSSTTSNTASATTDPVVGGTNLQVTSITLSANNQGRGIRTAVAEVVIKNDVGNPVSGAVVSGEFSGDINEAVVASTPTNTNGAVIIESTQSVERLRNQSFCVTAVSHPDLQDFSAAPGTVCGTL